MKLPIFVGTGIAAAADFNLNAISFDGSTEKMANTTSSVLGIANAWTINAWVKPAAFTGSQALWLCPEGPNNMQYTITSAGKLLMYMHDSAGSVLKNYTANTTLSVSTIYMLSTSWDGTNLKLYVDASEDTPYTKSTDNSGTMTDTSRTKYISGHPSLSRYINGDCNQVAMWDVVLTGSELTALFDSGVGYKKDYTNDFGAYSSSANIQHYWGLGKHNSPDLGKDYGVGTAIDMEANAVNITDADIVTF